jgi:catalase
VTGFTAAKGRTDNQEAGEKLRIRPELFADHYSHARLFWKSQTDSEQAHIASSFTFELSKVELDQVPSRMVANLRNVDEELARRVANGLGIELPKKAPAARAPIDVEPSPSLSIQKNMKTTLEGRKVGILIADGSDAREIAGLKAAIEKAGGTAMIVAPKVGAVKLSDGKAIKADGQLLGSPSQIFDAVALVLSEAGCNALMKEGAAVQFAMDAFGHLKAIGASSAAKPLLDKAGVEPDDGVTGIGVDFLKAAVRRFYDREPKIRSLA